MDDYTFSSDVWTPRWGHTDNYSVRMTDVEMTVQQGVFTATCAIGAKGDPVWSGGRGSGHALVGMFSADHIYVSEVVARALSWAWEQFRDGTAKDVLDEGLNELFAWVDTTSRATPKTQLWQGCL